MVMCQEMSQIAPVTMEVEASRMTGRIQRSGSRRTGTVVCDATGALSVDVVMRAVPWEMPLLIHGNSGGDPAQDKCLRGPAHFPYLDSPDQNCPAQGGGRVGLATARSVQQRARAPHSGAC